MKLPPVFLNHVYVVLDSDTYRDVETNTFLRREFAVTERRTTVMNGNAHTALYFYGATTYFELFDVADLPSHQMSFSGVAFGVDRAGGLRDIGRALAPDILVEPEPATRQYNGKQVPWFYGGGQADFPRASGLAVWLMEYHPRFLAEWNSQSGRDRGVSRQEVLQRYAAVLNNVPANPYFEDVVALTVAVEGFVQERLVALCKLLGYGAHSSEGTTVLKGPGVELRLVPQMSEARGVQEIVVRVTGQPEKRAEFGFGPKSRLQFCGDGFGRWSF